MSTNTEYQTHYGGTTGARVDIESQKAIGLTEKSGPPDFPEGGMKGWLVVVGAMIVTGCNFGYVSAFGYV